ncbi:MAG: O-antigen ligase family protein [Pseudomonadota bacterium]
MNHLPSQAHSRNAFEGDRWVFNGMLALLFWLPLPLASNRVWAVGILVAMVCTLCAGAAFAWRRDLAGACATLAKFKLPLALFGLFVALAIVQVLPLPAAVLGLLSPASLRVQQETQAALHVNLPLYLSLDLYQSRLMASLSIAYFLAFALLLLLVRGARRLERAVQAIVWSGLLQAMLGIFLFSVGAHYHLFFTDIEHSRALGTFVNRNHLAGYLEMSLALGIGLMLARLGQGGPAYPGWRQRLVAGLAFVISPKMRLRLMLVVMVMALVLTRSRMGNTAFFASLLAVGLVSLPLSWRTAPATVALIVSLLVVDIVIVGTWVGLEKVVERINDTTVVATSGHIEDSVEERLLPAHQALELIAQYPAFGTGAGSFYNAFGTVRPPAVRNYFDHAHNDYAEVASDSGLPAAALLAALVLATVVSALTVLVRRRSSLPRGVAFGVLMSIVALAIHSSVDFNLQIPANALTFVLILALGWAAQALPSRRPH